MATTIWSGLDAGIVRYDLTYDAVRPDPRGDQVNITFHLRTYRKSSSSYFGYQIRWDAMWCMGTNWYSNVIKQNSPNTFDFWTDCTATVSTPNNYVWGVRLIMTSPNNSPSGWYDTGTDINISVPAKQGPEDKTFIVTCNSSSYFEFMCREAYSFPTWSDAGGQDDMVWHGAFQGSWTRCGLNFNWAWGGNHSGGSLNAPWTVHVYRQSNSSNAGTCGFYPLIYVAYNANGGSSTPGTQSKYIGNRLTLASAISRTGHTFLGWSTSSGATSASYSAGQVIDYMSWNSRWNNMTSAAGWGVTNPVDKGTVTLYAVWSKNNYTIDLNGTLNGTSSGSLGSMATADVYINNTKVATGVADYCKNHPYGSTYKMVATAKTGYHFTDGTTSQTKSGTLGAGTADVRFALATNTYTVKYDANGGEGTTANSSHTYGVSKALTANGFTRIGYTFLGWSTNKSATSATYTNGQSVSNLTTTHGATVTLYAIWAMRAPYNVYTDFYAYRDKITVDVMYTGITSNNIVYYKTASASSYSTKDIGTATTYTLTGLQPNTEYYIYIKMTNGGGTTTTGTEIVETGAYIPSSPKITISDITAATAKAAVTATAETNAANTNYTIYIANRIPVNTYDMAIRSMDDGSVWARIFYHNSKQGTVLFSSLAEIKSTQTADKYSRLGQLSEFKRSNGTYEFMLRYPNYSDTLYNRWTQTSNPMEEFVTTNSSGTGTATGYTAVHIDWTGSYWGGLTRQNSNANSISSCYLSGSVGHTSWFYAIGATTTWGNGIPGALSSIDTGTVWGSVELWVRVDGVTGITSTNIGTATTKILGNLTQEHQYSAWMSVTNIGGKNYSPQAKFTTGWKLAQARTKVAGTWEEGDTYVKVNGEWKEAKKIYIKQNGAWISA